MKMETLRMHWFYMSHQERYMEFGIKDNLFDSSIYLKPLFAFIFVTKEDSLETHITSLSRIVSQVTGTVIHLLWFTD